MRFSGAYAVPISFLHWLVEMVGGLTAGVWDAIVETWWIWVLNAFLLIAFICRRRSFWRW